MGEEKLIIPAYFTREVGDPYTDPKGMIDYQKRNVRITDDSGNLVQELTDVIFPSSWPQHAANTTATKYLRYIGIQRIERETDVRQLAGRVAKQIAAWGFEQGYIEEAGKKTLEHELVATTVLQYGAFNSPVWFNVGLGFYEIEFEEEGYFHVEDGKAILVKNYCEHPQVAACFICSPKDSIEDMVRVAGVVSARIFKGGSGIGGDWSAVRSSGEPVSGGGYASGAVRFMDFQDSLGRVIKSGGKTRRAATMQSISAWHPDMPEVIRHKYKEEQKARILIKAGSPSSWESHTIQDLRAQNVNISIRTDDTFWRAYEKKEDYEIRRIVDGEVVRKEPARKLAEMIAFTAHQCGDPGIQNHTIINRWHTCKNSGEIWASNPCSEFMFLNDSACNLASLNLMKFRKEDGTFDLDSFCKGVDLYITSQDILVSKASYPTEEIALNSHNFRPLGLGYANLGAYIMSIGLAYDSDEARTFAAAVTSVMTAEAYLQSTVLAEKLGAFNEFEKNKEPMLEVMEMHRRAAQQIPKINGLESLVESAIEKWNEAIERGNKYGFRNSQVTLLAPTGTIGFMMGCDTTGCEPEFALKKYKELAGGGSMKIVNQTVPMALKRLGYSQNEIDGIVEYIDKHETLEGSVLKEEHLPVFDCAVSSGNGTRAIAPMGHIRMLGALQPHLSGAISKTINCPNDTTVEEIENMFYEGWRLGVKALAIYRDGSKTAQPLKTKKAGNIGTLVRGEIEKLPDIRRAIVQRFKISDVTTFIIAGEYEDGRLGELFINSFERGSEVNRLLNVIAIEFSLALQWGMPLREAIDVFGKAGKSQVSSGTTDHPFIKTAKCIEGFIFDWASAHYLGDISSVQREPEMRPLPQELRVYKRVPELHLIPTVAGEKFYPGVPSMEETIGRISGINYWMDEGLDTRKTIEKIKRERQWSDDRLQEVVVRGKITGKTCDKCGNVMISDGKCWKCMECKISDGGCSG